MNCPPKHEAVNLNKMQLKYVKIECLFIQIMNQQGKYAGY